MTYQNILNILYGTIEKNIKLYPDYNWYITGHSLGGALSILAGYLFAKRYNNKNFVIVSLASPRVGNYYFKKDFENLDNLKHYRICNNKDIVTAVPYINYYHCGYTIHYKNNKWIKLGNDYNDKKYNIFKLYNFYDHSCSKYVINLNNFNE